MHRTLVIAIEPEKADALCRRIVDNRHIINVSIQRGESIIPPADIITLRRLRRYADEVLREVQRLTEGGNVSIAISELTGIIDKEHESEVENNRDEAAWEEMETGLRRQGHVSRIYAALMALGGVAAVGLTNDGARQAVAFIAASIPAPGFEPLAKIPYFRAPGDFFYETGFASPTTTDCLIQTEIKCLGRFQSC